jgi:hypothetical protein
MNPITRIAPVTDEEATRMARPGTLSDLARQIVATPISTSRGASARSWIHNRPRRLLLGAPLAAGLAAAVVIVAVVGGVPGARHNGTAGPTVDAAYVIKRVDSALNAAGSGEIAQMTVTITRSAAIPGGTIVTATSEEWSYGDQWRSVGYSPTGQPVDDQGFSAASVYTQVNYLTRTWARQPGPGRPTATASGPRGCERMIAPLPSIGFATSSLTVARSLRAAVSCGTLAVVGWQRVDGIEAIELASRTGSMIPETIWVSPGTYLPVRMVIRSAPGHALVLGEPVLRLTADITWLPPTAQNLARLTVPIPPEFPRAVFPRAVRSALPPPARPRPNVQVTSAGATA